MVLTLFRHDFPKDFNILDLLNKALNRFPDNEFYQNLLKQFKQNGGLSIKQIEALEKIY